MALFANNWINVDLKHAAEGVIIKHDVGKIVEKPVEQPLIVARRSPINKQLSLVIRQNKEKIIENPTISERLPINKQFKSQYFRDMITLEKHMKASYSKDVVTGKHKKSSYVKEFVETK